LIHIDETADAATHYMAAALAERWPNVRVLESEPCQWCGYSLVRADLRAIERFLAWADDWTVYINLSGQCFPLQSQEEIAAYLDERQGHSFVDWFDPATSDHWPDGRARLERVALELPGRNQPWLVPGLRLDRAFLLDHDHWYGGSAWVALSREAAAYVASAETRRFRLFFRNTLCPEESFFQTVLLNSPYADRVINRDLHYIKWAGEASNPVILTADHYDAMVASGKLFARKFDTTVDDQVLRMLEQRIGRRGRYQMDRSASEQVECSEATR
jgi:hypothetical protein